MLKELNISRARLVFMYLKWSALQSTASRDEPASDTASKRVPTGNSEVLGL